MRPRWLLFLPILISFLLGGCATHRTTDPAWHGQEPEKAELKLSADVENRILALNPEHVTENDIKETLAHAPAPRIINIRGGIYPVYLVMASFSEFLEGMGYPEASIRDPGNGSYSYSCYESAGRFAGMIAWFYEHEGLRPMIIGHSQGGIQAVKVLHTLASSRRLHPWNPLTNKAEHGYDIVDPLSGRKLPVVKVKASYATAVSAGGLTRILPNQWDMTTKLRKIPDSVEEFTGFSKGSDPFGGDWWGYEKANQYHSMGTAVVRNVRLPSNYNHATIPNTRHLLKSQAIIDWINNYTPTSTPHLDVKFDADSEHILWAADVWYSIKKHWVLELQRLIRAKRRMSGSAAASITPSSSLRPSLSEASANFPAKTIQNTRKGQASQTRSPPLLWATERSNGKRAAIDASTSIPPARFELCRSSGTAGYFVARS